MFHIWNNNRRRQKKTNFKELHRCFQSLPFLSFSILDFDSVWTLPIALNFYLGSFVLLFDDFCICCVFFVFHFALRFVLLYLYRTVPVGGMVWSFVCSFFLCYPGVCRFWIAIRWIRIDLLLLLYMWMDMHKGLNDRFFPYQLFVFLS